MKACIIGTGAISGNHISALKKCGTGIAALCDIDVSKAKATAEKYDLNVPIYDDYQVMIDEIKPDCVHICTPHYLHAEMAEYALRRDINVLSEKPVCISLEQLERLDDAAKSTKARYAICFQNRFLPANIKAKEMLSSRRIYSASGSVLWLRDEKYYASGDWRGKWDTEGGGALINQAIHTLDLMLGVLGTPKSLSARMANRHLKNVIEVEDEMMLELAYDGFKAVFFATTGANGNHPVTINYVTDGGTVTTSGDKLYENCSLLSCGDGGEIIGKAVWGYGHDILISEYYKAIAAGTEFLCDYDKCRLTMLTVLMAYESAKNGQKQYF